MGIPAVDNHGPSLERVIEMNPLPEVQEGCGVVGDSVIRPLEEMELLHLSNRHLCTALPGQLRRRSRGRGRGAW